MSRTLRLAAALGLCGLLVALRVGEHFPRLPNPLALELRLDPGEPGRADPLIVSGRPLLADLLSVVFDDERTLRFTYDHWGKPALRSEPVPITPGETLRLEIAMPGLDQVRGSFAPASDQLRVTCNGRIVLEANVPHFVRERGRIFFGVNPVGGTACGPELRGRITGLGGRVLHGGPETIFDRGERLRDWLETFPVQLPILLATAVYLAWPAGRGRAAAGLVRTALRLAVGHRWFAGAAAVATAGFVWLATYGTGRFDHEEMFGAFYDYQASALLRGRLDVPEDAIGGEAFESRGRLYGYFGPTPALARLPQTLTGFGFGRLARLYVTAWFAGGLVAAYLIFQHARRRTAEPGAVVPPAGPFASLLLAGNAGLGSTLFFLGGRSFMYHEAILAGITLALWSAWCTLRHLEHPGGRWWIGALAGGVLSLHARPPTGLFALALLGTAVALPALGGWRGGPRPEGRALVRPVGIGLACLLGLLSLNGLAWLKFRTFDAAPLRLSRPYTGEPGRLEHIRGRSFHLENIPPNLDTYLLHPNLRLEPGFPWILLGGTTPRREYPAARIDLPDHTLALPYAMPGLGVLALAGFAAAAWHPRHRLALAALGLAVLPMTLALLAAVATAHRYTGDFCPFLIAAGAFGLAGLEAVRSRVRFLLRGLAAAATLASVAVTLALTLHYQRETLWGMPEEIRREYQEWRRGIDALVPWSGGRRGGGSG